MASTRKLLPVSALRELAQGSFEHVSLQIDEALDANAELFESQAGELTRLATFPDRVVVATSDGRYFSAGYQLGEMGVTMANIAPVTVGLVDLENTDAYLEEFRASTVRSLMEGKLAVEELVALMTAERPAQVEAVDLATIIKDIVEAEPDWKRAYLANRKLIMAEMSMNLPLKLSAKYQPLYDGTLDEAEFPRFLSPIKYDLKQVVSAFKTLHERVETAYLGVATLVDKPTLGDDQRVVGRELVTFGEGLSDEIRQLSGFITTAIDGEQCAMCVGQIYDTIAESMTEYQIAGSFVELMATNFADITKD